MFLRLTRRFLVIVLVLVVASSAGCFVMAGRWLVAPEAAAPGRADAIFVLAGGIVDRWLEGHDLWREGRGDRIVLSRGYLDAGTLALRKRGILVPDTADVARDVMVRQMGVPAAAVETIDQQLDNTADEAAAIRTLAATRGWTRVLVVTSKPHTRRTLLAMRREMAGTAIHVDVQGSRYDNFNAARWWRSRSDVRWVMAEFPKLVAYRLGLGR